MILIHTIFLFLLFSLFFLPQWLHRKRHPFMRRFYLRMTALPTARKLYRLVLLIVLFVFHFLYLLPMATTSVWWSPPLPSPYSFA